MQIFADLAPETLARRRLLKQLLEQMRTKNIKYGWGFPACLIGYKEGVSVILRYSEELREFCNRLELQMPDLPGWIEEITEKPKIGTGHWKNNPYKVEKKKANFPLFFFFLRRGWGGGRMRYKKKKG